MIELHKKYKSGTVLEILQEAILSGTLSGEITQDELALSLQTSRMPVREALIALEYQGLIERTPSQHSKIISFDYKSINEIFNDMALFEIESFKNFSLEKIHALLAIDEQIDFHKSLIKNINIPFRKKMLEILTGIYLTFVLEHSENLIEINAAFKNLIQTIKNNTLDFKNISECYKNYSEILSKEFMKIRKENNLLDVKFETR